MDIYQAICKITIPNETFCNNNQGSFATTKSLSYPITASQNSFRELVVNLSQNILQGAGRIASLASNSLFNFNETVGNFIDASLSNVRNVFFNALENHPISAIMSIRKRVQKIRVLSQEPKIKFRIFKR